MRPGGICIIMKLCTRVALPINVPHGENAPALPTWGYRESVLYMSRETYHWSGHPFREVCTPADLSFFIIRGIQTLL